MNRAAPITGRHWVFLAATLVLLVGALVLHGHAARLRGESDPGLTTLRQELASLASPNPAELARWRERHAALLARRWTESARAALAHRLGPRWRWVPAADGVASRTFMLHAAAPELLPWSAVMAALASLEATPGASVEAITIATAGTRTARNFAAVEIQVRLQWAEAGTGNTVPPESVRRDRVLLGPVWPGSFAEGRARAAPLRRTSASAEPPAPARSPLRSRPDHPRGAQSRNNLSQPQPT